MKRTIKIGVVGTAKNTGKTTTLLTLYNFLIQRQKKVLITGIGYDGEEIDNITFLPKPRIKVKAGTLVATSDTLINHYKISHKFIVPTSLRNSLGEIVFVEVADDSMVTIAGPTTRSGLMKIFESKVSHQSDYILVDGSINRLSPLELVDYLIFTTGFARTENLDQLALETKFIYDCFNIVKLDLPSNSEILTIKNLLNSDSLKIIVPKLSNNNTLRIKGIISGKVLIELLEMCENNIRIILDSPLTFIYSFSYENFDYLTSIIEKKNLIIGFNNKPELLCLTVNPSFPKFDGTVYKLESKSSEFMKSKIKEVVNLPVYDVMKDCENFYSFLSKNLIEV